MSHLISILGILLVVGYIFIIYSILHTKDCGTINVPKVPISNQIEVQILKEKVEKLQNMLLEAKIHKKDDPVSTSTEIIPIPVPPVILSKEVITAPPAAAITSDAKRHKIQGIIILGMHRSGTSVVGGLMNAMGLNTGGPLIRPGNDNEKGFFERIDAVLQNDFLMNKQGVGYEHACHKYDAKEGLRVMLSSHSGKEGARALTFLNDPASYPWMLKDPRLCITLRTWLPVLNFFPAVLFIFRHPLDVAMSLHKREGFPINKGLRMWYVYNKQALKNSNDLCRVTGSHRLIMANPRQEMDRLYDALVNQCQVPIPHRVSDEKLYSFIDVNLIHGKSGGVDSTCAESNGVIRSNMNVKPPAVWPTVDVNHLQLYRTVMDAYCGLEDGSAFSDDYLWDDSILD